jgi:hypothetical protein
VQAQKKAPVCAEGDMYLLFECKRKELSKVRTAGADTSSLAALGLVPGEHSVTWANCPLLRQFL